MLLARKVVATAVLLLSVVAAQIPLNAQSLPLDEQGAGYLPDRSYHTTDFDSVDLLTGRLTIHIPLLSYPQRGTLPPLNVYIGGGSSVVSTYTNQCNNGIKKNSGLVFPPDVMMSLYWSVHQARAFILTTTCSQTPPNWVEYKATQGVKTTYYLGGLSGGSSTAMTSADGSVRYDTSTTILTDTKGNQFTVGPWCYTSNCYPGIGNTVTRVQDRAGNAIIRTNQLTPPSFAGYWTDSVGRVIPDINKPGNGYPSSGTGCFTQSYPGPNGSAVPFTFCYSGYYLQSVTLPSGTSWQFSQIVHGSTADTATVTTPTGATISYQYTNVTPCGYPWNAPTGSSLTTTISAVQARTIDLHDGTPAKTWTYSYQNYVTTVTDPNGNDTVHTFSSAGTGTCPKVETNTQYFQGSSVSGGTLLKTVATTYYDPSANYLPYRSLEDVGVMPKTRTATWPNGPVSQESFVYDSSGEGTYYDFQYGPSYGTFPIFYSNLLQTTESDYGPSAPGQILRTTNYSYLWQSNPNYQAANMIELPCLVTVYGSGSVPQQPSCTPPSVQANQAAQTIYGYDESNGSPQGVFGNQTSLTRWLNTGASPKTQAVYNYQGMPTKEIDANLNATQITYDSTGLFPSQIQYPTTNGVAHIEKFSFDLNTGLLNSRTDQNSNSTSYQYDGIRRITTASYPDGGQTTYCYTDEGGPTCTQSAPPLKVVSTRLASPSPSVTTTTIYDGLGRPTETLNSDPDCSSGDRTDITYNNLGRVYTVSNPYCTTSDATYGKTTYFYDALGRACLVVPPDAPLPSGNTCPSSQPSDTVFTVYSTDPYLGSCATVTDEAGKARKSCSDGLGRVTTVVEDPSTGGLNYVTDYSYDALDNLRSVVQNESRQRRFAYDSLSRLTNATNPESGTITYSYDANGNLSTKTAPAPNQTGATTVTTTYSYDALNRLTKKTYSDGKTPYAQFSYDAQCANCVGRLTGTWDGVSTGTNFTYDPMGRTASTQDCAQLVCNTSWWITYSYDLAGHISTYKIPTTTNPSGPPSSFVALNQFFDSTGRVTQLTSSLVDSQHPSPLVTVDSSVGYWPTGALRKLTLGNGLYETAAYNNRLQPCHMNVNSSGGYYTKCTDSVSGNFQDFSYGFNLGSSDNGNVASWSATGKQLFPNRSYQYDALNRLQSMSAPENLCSGLSWTIDPWGNRTDQTVTGGNCYALHASVNTKNQLVDPVNNKYQYDAAGNMIQDASYTYTYDAENRIIQLVDSGGYATTFVYDPLGRRVAWTLLGQTLNSVYDLAGNVLFDAQGEAQGSNWVTAYIYFGGLLRALYKNSTTYFVHADHLGSTRLITDLNPTSSSPIDSMDYLPFGEEIAGDTATSHKFTAKARWEPDLDNFGFRYNSASLGRFMSPDPIGGDIGNPQSLNRYAYVLNNPLSLVDPFGLGAQDCFSTGTGNGPYTPCGGTNTAPDNIIPNLPGGIPGTAPDLTGGSSLPQLGSVTDLSSLVLDSTTTTVGPGVASSNPGLDAVQFGVGLVSAIPGLSELSLINAGISLYRGQYGQAAIDAAFALPIIGTFGRVAQLGEGALNAAKGVEGIYEFVGSSGRIYVGQSGNIGLRLAQHLESGALLKEGISSVRFTEVAGGKLAREIAEQLRIEELGGVGNLQNVRNAIGAARDYLMVPFRR